MNNNYSQAEAGYRPRWITHIFKKSVADFPVTVLTGARQVGKSTFLQQEIGKEWRYICLDDFDVQGQIRRNPELILSSSDRLIVDEVQKFPVVMSLIEGLVDKDKSRRFILSGSANLLLMSRVTESLAGRAVFHELGPMAAGEVSGRPAAGWLAQVINEGLVVDSAFETEQEDLKGMVWRGGMPAILHLKEADVLIKWREGYVASYLERDLRELSQIENLPDFRRLMQMIAMRVGQVLNRSALARDLGLAQPTAHRYVNLLETSMLVRLLQPWHGNRQSSLVKSPKIMWMDSGLCAHLAGFFSSRELETAREWGFLLECFVFSQLSALCSLMSPVPRLYYWRTRRGDEVDFVIEHGRRLLAVEVKAGVELRYEDTKGIQAFMRDTSRPVTGLLLYGGTEFRRMGESVFAVPLRMLWE
jgi:predicted AAA+ superfamily ATPase